MLQIDSPLELITEESQYVPPFDSVKYRQHQRKRIEKRLKEFPGRLYLEFGGKLEDSHASRVLPGFHKNEKLKMLQDFGEDVEIVIVISSIDIVDQKRRGDTGETYSRDVLRSLNLFRQMNLKVAAVVITRIDGVNQAQVDDFERLVNHQNIPVVRHNSIPGYPEDPQKVLEAFKTFPEVPVSMPIVVVTAPGPGSGKMATALAMINQDYRNGVDSSYAKFETFPVWDLPLGHPVNLAYEAATADLGDSNLIDPFYLDSTGDIATSYNRDVEAFPLLQRLLGSQYNSPTEMGVNMVSTGIIDNESISVAAEQEIIARFLQEKAREQEKGMVGSTSEKIGKILSRLNLSIADRETVVIAKEVFKKKNRIGAAISFPGEEPQPGTESSLLTASAAALLNALKHKSGVDDRVLLLSPSTLKPIKHMRSELGDARPLGISEVLTVLAIDAVSDNLAEDCLNVLPKIKGGEFHSTSPPTKSDLDVLRSLGVRVTYSA